MLLKTLLSLQAAQTGFDTRHVLALNVPVMSLWKDAGTNHQFLQRGDAANQRIAGRGKCGCGHGGSLARCGGFELRIGVLR